MKLFSFKSMRLITMLLIASIAFSAQAQVLPVTLESFTAVRKAEKVEVNWKSVTEVNCSTYAIQTSTTGDKFDIVAGVNCKGAGNYSLSFDSPQGVYVRLMQRDIDDKATVFNTVYIQPYESKQLSIRQSGYDLMFLSSSPVTVFDMVGRQVLTTQPNVNVNIADLPSGAYVAASDIGASRQVAKFFKL